MRGLPGSGKSLWARRYIIEAAPSVAVTVSADSYHVATEDGKSVYRFKPENARAAHDACLRDFADGEGYPSRS